MVVGPDIPEFLIRLETDIRRIDEQGLLGIETEAVDVEVLDVVVKAVVLRRIHGIEFVDLHKVEALHIRFVGRIDAGLFEKSPNVRCVPLAEKPPDPFDEMFRGLSGR